MNTNEFQDCINTVKGVGTISEINVEFKKTIDNVLLYGSIILSINSEDIRFNFFTSKKFRHDYYSILETIGIPYSFISTIDKDKYTLEQNPIVVSKMGSVKIIDSNKNILKNTNFIQDSNATKLFIIGKIDEYGNKITHIDRTSKEEILSLRTQGIPYKFSSDYIEFIIINKSTEVEIIRMNCKIKVLEKVKKIPVGSICDLKLKWNKGYDIYDNIITNVKKSCFELIDILPTDNIQDKDSINNLVKMHDIRKLG